MLRSGATSWLRRDGFFTVPRRLLRLRRDMTPSLVTPRQDAFFGYAATGRMGPPLPLRTNGGRPRPPRPSGMPGRPSAPGSPATWGPPRHPVRVGAAAPLCRRLGPRASETPHGDSGFRLAGKLPAGCSRSRWQSRRCQYRPSRDRDRGVTVRSRTGPGPGSRLCRASHASGPRRPQRRTSAQITSQTVAGMIGTPWQWTPTQVRSDSIQEPAGLRVTFKYKISPESMVKAHFLCAHLPSTLQA